MTRRALAASLAAGLLAGAVPAAASAALRPDPGFGAGKGYVTTRVPGRVLVGYGAASGGGGKVVVAGQATNRAGDGQIVVARYRADGRLDTTFATRGIFRTAFPRARGPFIATAVTREPRTGRLLVAGGYGLGSLLAMRLTANGRLDTTFGSGGLARTAAGGIAQSIALQRDGRILLGGSNANANGRPMAVARYTANGRLDRSFGRNGVAQPLFWNADIAVSAGVLSLAVVPDGGILGFAHLDYIGSDGHGSAGVFRLTSSGALAPGFGTGGHVEVVFTKPNGGFGQWFPCEMGIDGRGRIAIAGAGQVGSAAALLSARLTPQGVLDTSFGARHDGQAVTPGPATDSITTCGGVVTGAGALTAGVGNVLAQLRSNGTPAGRTRVTRPAHVAINGVLPAAKGGVVAVGSAGNALFVARYRG